MHWAFIGLVTAMVYLLYSLNRAGLLISHLHMGEVIRHEYLHHGAKPITSWDGIAAGVRMNALLMNAILGLSAPRGEHGTLDD